MGLTSTKCRFCGMFLCDDLDDMNKHICTNCWNEINSIFIIQEIKAEKEQNGEGKCGEN